MCDCKGGNYYKDKWLDILEETTSGTLRTASTQREYDAYLKNEYSGVCIFCSRDQVIKTYDYWVLLENRFPYDRVFHNHRLLAPKAHIERRKSMTVEEKMELDIILRGLDYDMMIVNKKRLRSIPLHWHLHLVTLK